MEHMKVHSLLKNGIGDSCEAPEHLEGRFLPLRRVEMWHSEAAAPASASLGAWCSSAASFNCPLVNRGSLAAMQPLASTQVPAVS